MHNEKRILIIGSGAREHAFGDLLRAEEHRLWFYPGNGGTSQLGEGNITNSRSAQEILTKPETLLRMANSFDIDLTIIGPELPAVCGVADVFREAGKLILCPSRRASQLEASKIDAKRFMKKYGIPTADFDEYHTAETVRWAAKKRDWKCAVKADGLCGGKGVHVCTTQEEVEAAIDELITRHVYGEAGQKGVVEDLLGGVETSFFGLADGKTVVDCGTAGDHKREFDGDKGRNTGGTGAFWPCPYVAGDESLRRRIVREIMDPTIAGMANEGAPFVGFLYAGLMLTGDGPMVVEFNVRFGDPEAQVVLPSISTDDIYPYELFEAAATGNLGKTHIPWRTGVRVGVVLMTGNYPGKERDGFKVPITGPIHGETGLGISVYHAATLCEKSEFFATPGRVLTVSAPGNDYAEAIAKAYAVSDEIHFEGRRFRRDIGKRAVEAVSPH